MPALVLVVAALGDDVVAAGTPRRWRPSAACRRPTGARARARRARAEAGARQPAAPGALAARERVARRAPALATSAGMRRACAEAVGVAERHRAPCAGTTSGAEGEQVWPARPTAALALDEPARRHLGGAARARRRRRSCVASVSQSATRPRSAAAKTVSGRESTRVRQLGGGQRAPAALRRRAGPRRSRAWPTTLRGFTSQYSNQSARSGRSAVLRIVTSCSSSGSSPNGA